MKSCKSKSKAKTVSLLIAKPPPPKRSRRAKQAQQQPRRELVVNYLQKKAVFSIGHLDNALGRALLLAFAAPHFRLSLSSLLLDLRPRIMRNEPASLHSLDAREAVSLFTHLMRKRRGQANLMRQLEEVEAIMKTYPLEPRDMEEEEEQERLQFNREVDSLRRTIKGVYVDLRTQLRDNFKSSEDYFKASLLEWKIRQMATSLIDQMVVAVKQVSLDKVEVIFEQPYPEKTCPRAFLANILGEARYTAKKINFVKYYREARVKHRRNSNFIVCHVCREPLVNTYLRCRNTPTSPIEPTSYNSPNTYERHLLSNDYLYRKPDKLSEDELSQQLDYFRYFELEDKHACNRFICKQCSEFYAVVESMQDISKYVCSFCNRACACRSCQLAQELVKSLAFYKHILKSNYQEMDSYKQLVKFANLDHECVEVFPRPRCTFESHPQRNYESYYMATLQEFAKINQVMDRMQEEAIRSFTLYQEVKMMITEYMSQVRSFVLQVKKQREGRPKMASLKSLARVREENRQIEQRLQKQREKEKTQDEMANTKISERMRSVKLKLKLIASAQNSQRTHRYQVPFEAIEIDKLEMFLEESEIQEARHQKTQRLVPVSEEELKRVAKLKKEFAFEKIDYEMAINVRPECKILDEKDLVLDWAMKEGIIYPENHRIFGFRATKINRFYEDAEGFCDYLEDSGESEEDEGVQEDVKNDVQYGDVSVSSFLRNYEGMEQEQYVIADNFADVSEYQDAGSSFLIYDQPEPRRTAIQNPQPENRSEEEDEDQMSFE